MMKRLLLALACACLGVLAAKPASRPRIYGIAFVRLKATTLEASRHFYSKALGLRAGGEGCRGREINCFPINPHQHLEIVALDSDASKSLLQTIGFTTSDVTAMRGYLFEHGSTPGPILEGPDHRHFFEVRDPEGNRIAFVESSGADFEIHSDRQVSNRLLHAGFVVSDVAAENKFYVDTLGFRLYWRGGFKDDGLDWYELQVPDGDNWIEYMLNIPMGADQRELGIQNHFSLGVSDAQRAAAHLRRNGLQKFDGPEIGRDGKNSLDAYDPDGTRVEIMEFTPKQKPCCSDYTGPHPKP
jgi:catechol 2,3-dioxygenase-like lactoylglutathione lyase family enzyme